MRWVRIILRAKDSNPGKIEEFPGSSIKSCFDRDRANIW